MTDPTLRDPAQNAAYYRTCKGYENNRDRFKEPRVQWVVSHLPPPPCRVLDLACNDGFLAELLPEGVEYHGVELNPVAVANAHPKAKGRIVEGDITQLRMDPDPFRWDAILALEVLEHLVDPVGFLRSLRQGLRKGGGRLITTSALGAGEGHEPGNREHLVEWNPAGFARLHVDAGYRIVEQAVARVYGERFTNVILATPKE